MSKKVAVKKVSSKNMVTMFEKKNWKGASAKEMEEFYNSLCDYKFNLMSMNEIQDKPSKSFEAMITAVTMVISKLENKFSKK